MYCVFHHISGHLPRQILFWKFSTKTWASVRPPPCWAKCPTFSENAFWGPPYLSLEEFSGTFHHFLITRLFTTHFTTSKEENHCPALIQGLKYPRTFQMTLFVCILIWTLSKLSNMLCHSLTSFGKPNISWWFYQDVMCKLWAKTLKGPGILNFSAMWKLHKEQLLQNS